MSQSIHPTAVIADGATLGADVVIGPYCVVGAQVTLGDGVHLVSHVVVDGHTEIGDGTEIFPFASIGHRPQDKKFKGEDSRLSIGKRNVIREHVTMNPGTEGGGLITRVGDDCLFMASAHVAHDCQVGNQVILANNATLAGHVTVGDGVIIGGLAAVHQFVRIGNYAFVGGMTGITKDLIPYGMVVGDRGALSGLNLVGLRRRQISREEIKQLRELYDQLFTGEGTLAQRAAAVDAASLLSEAKCMLDFVMSDSSRSFCTPAAAKAGQPEAA
ncbi:MAG: acyl-ACP--UDP-N-acetylglucosamine O-acyltransferase [Alphaproteobacteria bacterium]|nr:acyl-ACP--UDP-N-acetylglucosamine O-acyltransferase [Alphaproteobacteria bacterium]